jgi:putative nucleotidyltransferase with HDIG domain
MPTTLTGPLRRRVLARLVLTTIALATLAGGAAYLAERYAVDQRILTLVLEESHGLAWHAQYLATRPPGELDAARDEVRAHLLTEHMAGGNFVVIELYDLAQRRMLEAVVPAFARVERAVDASHRAPGSPERVVQRWITVEGRPFVQVLAPLQLEGATVASLEGIYQVDPATMRRMNRELAWSVLVVVLVVLATGAVLYPAMLRLNGHLLRLSDDLAHANMGLLSALGSAVARRDRGTNAHNFRVTIYAIHLGRAVGLSDDQVRGLIKGAFLHDVGKIGITDAILRKPGRLTADESAVMRAHVRFGVEIVRKFEWLSDALDVVRCHHERVDGSGYPAGLRGTQIPITARVFTVVDVFDALTTRRPYKEPLGLEETLRTMEQGRGRIFDPEVLDAFLAIAPGLHRTISRTDEPQLARALDRLLALYFPARAGAHGGRGPPRLTATPVPGEEEPLEYLSGGWSLRDGKRDDAVRS